MNNPRVAINFPRDYVCAVDIWTDSAAKRAVGMAFGSAAKASEEKTRTLENIRVRHPNYTRRERLT